METKIISDFIIPSLKELDLGLNLDSFSEKEIKNSILFGENAILDSIGLVTLIISIEEKLKETSDEPISLSNEKAFSPTHSPFKTVETLSNYISSMNNG